MRQSCSTHWYLIMSTFDGNTHDHWSPLMSTDSTPSYDDSPNSVSSSKFASLSPTKISTTSADTFVNSVDNISSKSFVETKNFSNLARSDFNCPSVKSGPVYPPPYEGRNNLLWRKLHNPTGLHRMSRNQFKMAFCHQTRWTPTHAHNPLPLLGWSNLLAQQARQTHKQHFSCK